MRLRLISALGVLLTACAAPHSSGAVWAQQNLDAERAMFQLSDAQRAQAATDFLYSLVDEDLVNERQRLGAVLQTCPGPTKQITLSSSDKLRDGMRVEAQNDPTRMAQIADAALADWYLRRAAATGMADFCARASAALNGTSSPSAPSQSSGLLVDIPVVTVTRDSGQSSLPEQPGSAPLAALSEYALGYVDAVQADAPLPQYLAAVYGGVLDDASPRTTRESAESTVDEQAVAYPQWEPDALYLALRGGSMP